ncbi:hypothetical protein IscW_ISCW017261 [Ixodes scapularis]|uniref:Uncharacterized protein n=1 Tax=Ixodes scapularis TaxID=6945 RepID=B7PBH3_IXOSC|nr:hypothetical protein IscW_ISCW017261 [Ixodes scapularis]|eukprot:XP_002408152.1 hypothetical protein IscW_ISCW017261 [Ixodes scapularis]
MNHSPSASGSRSRFEMASVLRRELAGESGCYCCHTVASLSPRPTSPPSSSADTTDLDASLRELGMLSAVTDSRHDYVLEKLNRSGGGRFVQQRSPDFGHHHSGLCVLAMNSAYIADFSFSAAATTESPPSPSETVPLLTLKRPRVRGLRRKHYLYQPYDYPWRPKLVAMLKAGEPPVVSADVRFEEPKVALENGNKSNPGSPAKPPQGSSFKGSPAPLGSVAGGAGGAGIFRSKSLDDLEVCSAKATGTRMDIETVSRKISNLHVS